MKKVSQKKTFSFDPHPIFVVSENFFAACVKWQHSIELISASFLNKIDNDTIANKLSKYEEEIENMEKNKVCMSYLFLLTVLFPR